MRRRRAAQIFSEVDPNLNIVAGGNRHRQRSKTVAEIQASNRLDTDDVRDRIRLNPAPQRVRKEWDDNWNPTPDPVCPMCRRNVPELFPYGFTGKRLACAECLERRRKTLEMKARVLASRPVRGAATMARMMMIRSAAKQK